MNARILQLAAGLFAGVAAASATPVEVGDKAPSFTLPALEGEPRALESFRGKHVVLEWINHDCPFVIKHYASGNLPRLQREFRERGVIWLAICSSAPGTQGHFTPEVWARRNEAVGFAATALLLDEDGAVGRAYGATRTPEMVIIDPEGVIIYRGAIDNRPGRDPAEIEGAVNFVRQALTEALAGRPVSVPTTRPYGCTVKY